MIFWLFGISICLAVLLQMGMWFTHSITLYRFNQLQLKLSRQWIQQQIEQAKCCHDDQQTELGNWKGYREFIVDRLERETESVISVFLKSIDQKPLAPFRAGQYVSIKFPAIGDAKPAIRCYSLSNASGQDHYRISVKAVPSPPHRPELPPGRVSHFIHQHLIVGDRLDVKAPSGSFVLPKLGDAPLVLLAGGIGITPLMSMLEELWAQQTERVVVLFYGVRCGREHAFKDRLNQISHQVPSIHVVTCYSQPTADDQLNVDYQVGGYVSVDLLKMVLPDHRCQFYLCGPASFTQSLRQGLIDWGVPSTRIHTEAFGPASLSPQSIQAGTTDPPAAGGCTIQFVESQQSVKWHSDCENILRLAEDHDIELDSGCRAGSCGTCATRLIDGTVVYPSGIQPCCSDEEILPCVARPNGNLVLGA